MTRRPLFPPGQDPDAPRLWIVQYTLGCSLNLESWPLLRETPDSYIVRLRGGSRLFRKGAA